MTTLNLRKATLSVDFDKGLITSFSILKKERLAAHSPLFCVQLRDSNGDAVLLRPCEAGRCVQEADGALYTDFPEVDASVFVGLRESGGEAEWRIRVSLGSDRYFTEWVDFPSLALPRLAEGCGSKILFPYNEGVLISNSDLRESSWLCHREAVYPSMGCYSVFPNMLSSQMISYIFEDAGIYIGAHDERRGVKEIDFVSDGDILTLRMRIFCGSGFGQSYATDYPIVFSVTDPDWESSAERYRSWFESCLPDHLCKTAENEKLPEWYSHSPLVVTYPIRGRHDTDEMTPNKLYPYTNALPILKRIKESCGARLLVLLMHWEGTAPWAPPYVWPPFGSIENFELFERKLHESGDLLGVYCSGFGYTLQSKLIPSYSKKDEYVKLRLRDAMCASPDGEVAISNICTEQRSGYDICPASRLGRELLLDAYSPLFESGIDYAQILDQNHGGGQYFCYSREHGHPPAPGAWMSENMQAMLSEWKALAGNTLFGCESAAAEPFIRDLSFSDNRFELNYFIGTPVPLYSYIYHEYVRNFMGNQVCCPFADTSDSLCYRLAYSFSIGDSMTLVLTEDGDIASYWGMRDFTLLPDKDAALTLISNLTRFYQERAKPYLCSGRMVRSPALDCDTLSFALRDSDRTVTLPALLCSAWETDDGTRALVIVNPEGKEATCRVAKKEIRVPPLDAILIRI